MNRLEAHFRKYRWYYGKEQNKVACAVPYLQGNTLNRWAEYTSQWTVDRAWAEFRDFCLRKVNDPSNLQREAIFNYFERKQLDHQSVRDFAIYLAQWERLLPHTLIAEQQKAALWAKVAQSVR